MSGLCRLLQIQGIKIYVIFLDKLVEISGNSLLLTVLKYWFFNALFVCGNSWLFTVCIFFFFFFFFLVRFDVLLCLVGPV